MNVNGQITAFINPIMEFIGDEQFELWNDCLMKFEGDLSELIQHEYDHLDGILAVERALNLRSFRMKG